MSSRRQTLISAYKLIDILVMVFSFGLAGWITFFLQKGGISFGEFLSMRIRLQNFAIFIGFVIAWHLIFSGFRLYEPNRMTSRIRQSVTVLQAAAIGLTVYASASMLFRVRMITPMFLLAFWVASSSISVLSRLLLGVVLRHMNRRNRNLRYILIVGTNERAVRFAAKIESEPELGYRLVGFVENGWSGDGSFDPKRYRVVCGFSDFRRYIRENAVDEVMVCLPIKSFYNQISAISSKCEEQGIVVRHLSDFFELKSARYHAGDFGGEPVVSIHTGAMDGWQVQVKRMLDVLLSTIMLMAFSPLLLLVAVIIKISSPGPVFFVQERIGLNKRRFSMYKFRTMVPDAEKRIKDIEELNEASGPVFKIKKDPRITPIGRVLRKTSIDELPQLLNVLTGDMSLVGPRALPVRDYEGFRHDSHRRRFSVRPGITCTWQVAGRNNIPFERWMELDLQYIDQWSLWLDVTILFRTFPAVLKGSGAS